MNYFFYKGNQYFPGTVVKIYDKYRSYFDFYTNLKFYKYDNLKTKYVFTSLYSLWEHYEISEEQLKKYIEKIEKPCVSETNCNNKQDINLNYVDGYMSSLIWYIIAMIFAIFLKGAHNVIIAQLIATIIFFNWRSNKMKGK